MNESVSIRFLGAAGTVTGSKYLLRAFGKTMPIDCGLFQGLKKLRSINWQPFPIDPKTIDLVLLTHGHLDHVGYLPRLVREGFNGQIWSTSPTLEVAKIILEDSAKIQEKEAERANQFGYGKHKKALLLYDLNDVKKTSPLFTSQPQNQWLNISDSVQVRFQYNGHIIGATFIEIKAADKIIVFSGDIGRINDPLLYPPES
ncbi:MAG TPA: MBL fold metallo-hydrolase, partial [Cyclobacteriaceae bacterium]